MSNLTNLNIFETGIADENLISLNKQCKERKFTDHTDTRKVDQAISLLKQYRGEARIIAGGTDIISLMKNKVLLPRVLINIKTIPGLSYIKEAAGELKIGSLTTIHEIENSAVIKDKYRILAEAAHSVAAPQIRNMGTVGGNLCQSVRCWYYRRSSATGRSFFCRRKGGDQCFAVTGDNTHSAIIGRGVCRAVCPSDLAPALIALDARLKIAGPSGEKIVPLGRFYTNMGNVLEIDEIILEIQVPALRSGIKQKFLKFRIRKAIDFAVSSAAAVITIEDSKCCDARIVLGGVAPTPYRAVYADEALKGKAITVEVAEEAGKLALKEAVPLSMNGYKVPISETLVKRAILEGL